MSDEPCKICGGEDGVMPCGFPSGCMRDQRRIAELERARDAWEGEAKRYCENADYWRERAEKAERENAELREVMVAAAEEIAEHWDAHCDKDGYGPTNLARRLENGIATSYPGYSAGAFAELRKDAEKWRDMQKRSAAERGVAQL